MPMNTYELIPTTHKDKLPKNWSYPIGAETISKAVNSIRFTEELVLAFKWFSGDSQSEFLNKVNDHGEINVLECEGLSFPGDTDKHYPLYIFAVPSDIKNDVHHLLEDDILPKFTGWLTDSSEKKRFTVYLDLKSRRFRVDSA